MHAQIYSISSAHRAILYNERKVTTQQASFLDAQNLPLPAAYLTPALKKDFFKHWDALNLRSEVKGLHISLSFALADQLSIDLLKTIARSYMEKINFGEQPFLVYLHQDTFRPHLHLVSTQIGPQGKRMETGYIHFKHSRPAVRAIEQQYGLHRAKKDQHVEQQRPSVARYGTQPTAQTIEQITQYLLNNYTVSDFQSWSALLEKYRIKPVPRPPRESNGPKGMLYFILDDRHRTVSRGVQASSLQGKPTAKHLEEHFSKNALQQAQAIERINKLLQFVFRSSPRDLPICISHLRSQGIEARQISNPATGKQELVWIDFIQRHAISSSKLNIDRQLLESLSNQISHREIAAQNSIQSRPRLSRDLSY